MSSLVDMQDQLIEKRWKPKRSKGLKLAPPASGPGPAPPAGAGRSYTGGPSGPGPAKNQPSGPSGPSADVLDARKARKAKLQQKQMLSNRQTKNHGGGRTGMY